MKHLYKVELEVKYTSVSDWMAEKVMVVANGDAEHAIRKAKKHVLQFHFDNAGNDARAIKSRLVTVEQICAVDVI